MASLGYSDSPAPEGGGKPESSDRNVINNYYAHYGQVNNIREVHNACLGDNYGTVARTTVENPAAPQGPTRTVIPVTMSSRTSPNLTSLLNPIPDASYTRDRKRSPPNSACFPGTRKRVIKRILSWVNSSVLLGNPHIMWVYGYAGCGKSAIAQAIAELLAQQKRLAASFFFFRGAADRARVARFANSVAHQVAAAIPATAPLIEAALTANPALATSGTELSAQFEHLVYEPIYNVKWDRLAAALRHGPYLIVLDGLDECMDHDEVGNFIHRMIAFFERKPFVSLRFLITSRVENHIHQQLHSSKQVKLLNLAQHTSDSDISTALDIAISKGDHPLVRACAKSWPSAEEKAQLVKHIGGSFIFLTTIIKLLFDPYTADGRTPMERLPEILGMQPDFDDLYQAVLAPAKDLPHFQDIVNAIALSQESLSVSLIADLLNVKATKVASVLIKLHSIMQIPGDDRTPVTLWHTSLRDYLCSESRSGPFYVKPAYHQHLAYRCFSLALAPSTESPPSDYFIKFAFEHFGALMTAIKDNIHTCDQEVDDVVNHIQGVVTKVNQGPGRTVYFAPPSKPDPDIWTALEIICLISRPGVVWIMKSADLNCPFRDHRTALEVASNAQNWDLVRNLINAGVDINKLFRGNKNGIMCALHAACHYKQLDLVYLLLNKGANPNVASPNRRAGEFDDGTPLAFAAWKGDVKLATRLLECGADPNLQGGVWGTALRAACAKGSLEIVELLLDHGADPNLRDGRSDKVALHVSAWHGHESCARALLMRNADPNLQNNSGDTPLHYACYNGEVRVVECLLEFKADASIKNKIGQTALQVA